MGKAKTAEPQKVYKVKATKIIAASFDVYKKNFKYFVSLTLVVMIFNILNSFADKQLGNLFLIFRLLFQISSVVLGSYLTAVFMKTALISVRDSVSDWMSVWYLSPMTVVRKILVDIIVSLIIIFGIILFVIPGIIFALKLQFAGYMVVDGTTKIADAIKNSWRITKGTEVGLLALMVVLILINILGIITFGIGLLLTYPLFIIAQSYVYNKLLNTSEK